MDLSICSRMLYHWAIPPYISVDVYLQKTFCICMNILTEHLFKWLHEWTLTNVIKCWCLDFFCNSILYILKTKHNFGIMIIRFQWTRNLIEYLYSFQFSYYCNILKLKSWPKYLKTGITQVRTNSVILILYIFLFAILNNRSNNSQPVSRFNKTIWMIFSWNMWFQSVCTLFKLFIRSFEIHSNGTQNMARFWCIQSSPFFSLWLHLV